MKTTPSPLMNRDCEFVGADPDSPTPGNWPAHLQPPDGVSPELHEINRLISAIMIGANATYMWLNRAEQGAGDALGTVSRLSQQIAALQKKVEDLGADAP